MGPIPPSRQKLSITETPALYPPRVMAISQQNLTGTVEECVSSDDFLKYNKSYDCNLINEPRYFRV